MKLKASNLNFCIRLSNVRMSITVLSTAHLKQTEKHKNHKFSKETSPKCLEHWTCNQEFPSSSSDLALVVQKMDSAIYRIIIRETNCAIQLIVIYSVDSAIHLSNNWRLTAS